MRQHTLRRAMPEPGALAAGQRLGEFELVAPLGQGGQGQAYLAWPAVEAGSSLRSWARARLALGGAGPELAARWRLAAIKVARAEGGAALFDEHAALAATPAHPGLVQLYGRAFPGTARRDLGIAALPEGCTAHWLACAYEPGRSLGDLIGRGAALSPRAAVGVAAQLAAALAHMHQAAGLAHLDLKPANVIVRPGPGGLRAVLIDLGAAEPIGGARRRAIYGTGPYLAPERLAGAAPAPAADIYALGILLAELAGPAAPPELARLATAAADPDPLRRACAIPTMAALHARLELLLADPAL